MTMKSQLSALQGSPAVAAPQSQLARFVFGEIKGGEARHDFAMSIIHGAVVQALKGNQRDIPEAVKFASGKSAKARAYFAGFHAIADSVKPVPYKGKLDAADNKAVRELIHTEGARIAADFELAYLAMLEQAKEERAAARASKAATAPAAAAADDNASASASNDTPVATVEAEHAVIDIDTALDAVTRALAARLLSTDEVMALRVALSSHDHEQLQAA